jgi:F-type H+-transporting ATPase subunit epsilon
MEEKREPRLLLEVVTPLKRILKEEVSIVLLPCAKGYLSAMVFHVPLISTLRPGILEYIGKSKKGRLFVEGGFVEILPKKVTVIAERVETEEEIDPERTKELFRESEEKLRTAKPGDKELFISYEEATQKLLLLDKHNFVL